MFWRRKRDKDRIIKAELEKTYKFKIQIVDEQTLKRRLKLFREREDAAALTLWPRNKPPEEATATIMTTENITYGLLAHELRHVLEHDFHRGRHVYDP